MVRQRGRGHRKGWLPGPAELEGLERLRSCIRVTFKDTLNYWESGNPSHHHWASSGSLGPNLFPEAPSLPFASP